MKKIVFAVLLVCTVGIVVYLCSAKSDKPVEQQGFYMGTIISERVSGHNAKKAADQAMEEIKRLEGLMTINANDSEIDKLNAAAGKNPVKLSKESMYVLKTALKYAGLSNGAFDVTVGPLVKTWGVFTDHPRVPAQNEINNLLKLVNYRDVQIDQTNGTAALRNPGQIVDLGGIAKGYAGDAVIDIYKKNGIKSAYIDLGGNVVVLGSKPDGSPWRVGIQNPRAPTGKYIGILNVTNKAVVTSGDYERYFEMDGKRYHHILDPHTGYPSNSGLISTTIITDSSTEADALSTATFVLGLEKGKKLVESLKGVEAVFITADKKIYITKGLKNIFTFDDESKEYTYVQEG
ncbi:MAG: FAD:protein FMN transferase [Bacillota bacterium]|nr:FAD:protein FMN transferase [Bacillota bacterium]